MSTLRAAAHLFAQHLLNFIGRDLRAVFLTHSFADSLSCFA